MPQSHSLNSSVQRAPIYESTQVQGRVTRVLTLCVASLQAFVHIVTVSKRIDRATCRARQVRTPTEGASGFGVGRHSAMRRRFSEEI